MSQLCSWNRTNSGTCVFSAQWENHGGNHRPHTKGPGVFLFPNVPPHRLPMSNLRVRSCWGTPTPVPMGRSWWAPPLQCPWEGHGGTPRLQCPWEGRGGHPLSSALGKVMLEHPISSARGKVMVRHPISSARGKFMLGHRLWEVLREPFLLSPDIQPT